MGRSPERPLLWGVKWGLRKEFIRSTDKLQRDQRTRGWALMWLKRLNVGVQPESQAKSGQLGESLKVEDGEK